VPDLFFWGGRGEGFRRRKPSCVRGEGSDVRDDRRHIQKKGEEGGKGK